MSDTKSTVKNTETMQKSKFSIIDLLMIIMVVGVVLTIILPLQQTRRHEALVRSSLTEMEKIIRANEDFKLYSGWDTYAMDIGQLNLRDLDTSALRFAITDTSVVAITTNLGGEEKGYWFDLRDKRFRVNEDSRDKIVDAWLP